MSASVLDEYAFGLSERNVLRTERVRTNHCTDLRENFTLALRFVGQLLQAPFSFLSLSKESGLDLPAILFVEV